MCSFGNMIERLKYILAFLQYKKKYEKQISIFEIKLLN